MRRAACILLLMLSSCMQSPDQIRARGTTSSDLLKGDPAELANCAAERFDSANCGFWNACPTSVVRVTDGGAKASTQSKVGNFNVWVVDFAREPGGTRATIHFADTAQDRASKRAEVQALVQACAKPS